MPRYKVRSGPAVSEGGLQNRVIADDPVTAAAVALEEVVDRGETCWIGNSIRVARRVAAARPSTATCRPHGERFRLSTVLARLIQRQRSDVADWITLARYQSIATREKRPCRNELDSVPPRGRFFRLRTWTLADLLPLLQADKDVLSPAIRTLGRMGPAARPALPDVLRLVQERPLSSDVLRVISETVLAMEPGRDRLLAPLRSLLRSCVDDLRMFAAATLARIGAKAIPVLIDALEADDSTRDLFIQSMARIGCDAVPRLVRLLQQPASLALPALAALHAMDDNGAAALPHLIASLGHAEAEVRFWAVFTLAELGPTAVAAVPTLQEVVADPREDTRIRCLAVQASFAIAPETVTAATDELLTALVDAYETGTLPCNPDEASLLYGVRGEVRNHLNAMGETIPDLERSLQLNSEAQPPRWDQRATAYAAAGNPKPAQAMALYRRGQAEETDGEFAKALRHYQQATDVDPNNALLRAALAALILKVQGQIDPFDMSLAVAHARRACELQERCFSYRRLLAICYAANGRHAEASECQQQAVGLASEEERRSAVAFLGRLYLVRGLERQEGAADDQAVLDFEVSMRLMPGFPDAEESQLALPSDAFGARAEAYARKGRLEPKESLTHYNRGVSAAHKKRFRSAVRELENAIAFDPQFSWAHNNLAWLLATCEQASLRDGRRAVELATTACELSDWDYWCFLGTLAAAYAEAGQFDKAAEYGTKSVALAPEARRPVETFYLNRYRQGLPWIEFSPQQTDDAPDS
jgi:tetratricopeptide (TPR) repeat protein